MSFLFLSCFPALGSKSSSRCILAITVSTFAYHCRHCRRTNPQSFDILGELSDISSRLLWGHREPGPFFRYGHGLPSNHPVAFRLNQQKGLYYRGLVTGQRSFQAGKWWMDCEKLSKALKTWNYDICVSLCRGQSERTIRLVSSNQKIATQQGMTHRHFSNACLINLQAQRNL